MTDGGIEALDLPDDLEDVVIEELNNLIANYLNNNDTRRRLVDSDSLSDADNDNDDDVNDESDNNDDGDDEEEENPLDDL